MAQYHLTIDSSYKARVEELAKEYSGSNRSKLIEAMIDYFIYYQLNPNEREVNLDSKFAAQDKKIDKLRDTFVSFIRELEKKKLEPLIKQSNESTMALLVFLKEQALTKDDIKSLNTGGRRVALFENKEEKPIKPLEYVQNEPDDEMTRYKQNANATLLLYKTYFNEMVHAVSRKDEKGDFLLMSAVNNFKDKIRTMPKKILYEGTKNEDVYEVIDKVETILRITDNYCDEFLNLGKAAVGKDKFFYLHTIQEYKLKFENLRIM